MKMHVQAAGAVMALAAVALTGCGGSTRSAQDVAGRQGASLKAFANAEASAKASAVASAGKSLKAKASAAASAAVSGPAKVGRFCTTVGAVAKTSDGTAVKCTIASGQKRGRWTAVAGSPTGGGSATMTGAVHPGAYCSPQGATGKDATGTAYTCSKQGSDTQARWHKS